MEATFEDRAVPGQRIRPKSSKYGLATLDEYPDRSAARHGRPNVVRHFVAERIVTADCAYRAPQHFDTQLSSSESRREWRVGYESGEL